MDCAHALEALSAQLDGELSPRETQELNTHLDACPTCRALARELSALHDACGGWEVAPPPGLKDQILSNLPPQEPVKLERISPKKTVRRWQRWAAMAATFALVCMAAWQLPKFLFTNKPQDNVSPSGMESAVTTEDSAGNALFSGADEGVSASAAGGAAVTGSASDSDASPEDVPEGPVLRSAEVSEAPAEVPTQGALSDAAQTENGIAYTGVNDANEAQKSAPSAASTPSAEAKQAALTEAAPVPQPSAAPAASSSTLLRSIAVSNGLSQNSAAPRTESAAPEDAGLMEYSYTAEDAPVSPAGDLPTTGGGGGSGGAAKTMLTSSAPQEEPVEGSTSLYAQRDAISEEVPSDTDPLQPYVDTTEFEKVVLTAGLLPTYCGEITLLEGKLLGDYPQEELPDGTVRCTLPAHRFWALLRQLEEGELSYQFQRTGDHIDPAAGLGLVIMPVQ